MLDFYRILVLFVRIFTEFDNRALIDDWKLSQIPIDESVQNGVSKLAALLRADILQEDLANI